MGRSNGSIEIAARRNARQTVCVKQCSVMLCAERREDGGDETSRSLERVRPTRSPCEKRAFHGDHPRRWTDCMHGVRCCGNAQYTRCPTFGRGQKGCGVYSDRRTDSQNRRRGHGHMWTAHVHRLRSTPGSTLVAIVKCCRYCGPCAPAHWSTINRGGSSGNLRASSIGHSSL